VSLAYAPDRILAPLVTDDVLRRELCFAEEYQVARYDRWIASLLASIRPDEHSALQDKLRASLVARLAPYHAWHEKIPFVTLHNIDRGGTHLGAQFSNHSPVTLGNELEHVVVYGPTGSGKSHLLAHLLHSVLVSEEE
jgi:Cdc6-like AAA superfamily ATPase